jgi:hypothetical protein
VLITLSRGRFAVLLMERTLAWLVWAPVTLRNRFEMRGPLWSRAEEMLDGIHGKKSLTCSGSSFERTARRRRESLDGGDFAARNLRQEQSQLAEPLQEMCLVYCRAIICEPMTDEGRMYNL